MKLYIIRNVRKWTLITTLSCGYFRIPNGLNVGESCGSCLAFPFLIVSIVFIFCTSCLQVNHIQFNVCKVLWTNTFFSWLCGLQLFRIDTYYLIIEKISQNQCVFKTRTHIDIVIFKTLKHFKPYWRRKYSEYEKPHFRSSPRRCSVKKGVLKNFANFTEGNLWQSLFFNKVAWNL